MKKQRRGLNIFKEIPGLSNNTTGNLKQKKILTFHLSSNSILIGQVDSEAIFNLSCDLDHLCKLLLPPIHMKSGFDWPLQMVDDDRRTL